MKRTKNILIYLILAALMVMMAACGSKQEASEPAPDPGIADGIHRDIHHGQFDVPRQ